MTEYKNFRFKHKSLFILRARKISTWINRLQNQDDVDRCQDHLTKILKQPNEEPNGNFRTEKYNNLNKKDQISSTTEGSRGRKESENLQIEIPQFKEQRR